MRSRPHVDHQEAVTRRLALLSAELAAVRASDATTSEPGLPPGSPAPEQTPEPEPESEPDPTLGGRPAPRLPVPGRHASRRRGPGLTGLLPEPFRGRVALEHGQVAVLAVLVAIALALCCWWVVRGRATQVAPAVKTSPAAALVSTSGAVPAAGASAGEAPGAPGTSGTAGTGSVTVDVAGRVRRPGIAVLDAGSRVVDALEAAGGARQGVDLSGLNLARVLVDGEQVLVGEQGAPGPAAAAATGATGGVTPGAPGGTLVNLNTAGQTELEALPEVGPVTAGAIIAWREEHGGFGSVDQLLDVDGIGDATLAQLAPFVTV